jgi:hypothetical protein
MKHCKSRKHRCWLFCLSLTARLLILVAHLVGERATRVPGKTDASRDLVILAKDRRIKALEAEIRQLKKEQQQALGKAYDQL